MGLQIPNSSFVHPNSDLRTMLSKEAVKQIVAISTKSSNPLPLGLVLDERSFVNAMVGLLATGGSTNHMLHLPAMAAAAGIILKWEDFEELSKIVPLIARVYPNGYADVNEFHNAGGMNFIFHELFTNGLLDTSAKSSWGENMADFIYKPEIENSKLIWKSQRSKSGDESILRPVEKPFMESGGIKDYLLLGRFQAGRRDGQWVQWYRNGQKEVEGNYENDEPVKTWLWWYIDGAPMQEGEYNTQGNFEGLYFINPPVPDVLFP